MPGERVLVLGGTGAARELAGALMAAGFDVVTSLAGVTQEPLMPAGQVRIGGFGGVEGLTKFLAADAFSVVADATHPFAATMSAHAAEACRQLSLPLLRLEPAPWSPGPADRWTIVRTIAEASGVLPSGARVLLTIGRKEVAPFFARDDISGIARMIETPPAEPPPQWRVLRARPPFTAAAEAALMAAEGITHLVTKNAGDMSTAGKLEAARERGIPVVMVARPAKPEVPCFTTAEALARAAKKVLSP